MHENHELRSDRFSRFTLKRDIGTFSPDDPSIAKDACLEIWGNATAILSELREVDVISILSTLGYGGKISMPVFKDGGGGSNL